MAEGGHSFNAVNAVGSGYVQAQAQRDQADYEKKMAELNNKTLDYEASAFNEQADDALKRGSQAANRRAQKARLQIGAQRAAMAAGGGGISQDVVNETDAIAAADEASIKVNSYREAFGLQNKAIQVRGAQAANTFQAKTKANALEYAARSSMITGWNEGIGHGFKAFGSASSASDSKSSSKSTKGYG